MSSCALYWWWSAELLLSTFLCAESSEEESEEEAKPQVPGKVDSEDEEGDVRFYFMLVSDGV